MVPTKDRSVVCLDEDHVRVVVLVIPVAEGRGVDEDLVTGMVPERQSVLGKDLKAVEGEEVVLREWGGRHEVGCLWYRHAVCESSPGDDVSGSDYRRVHSGCTSSLCVVVGSG